MPHLGPLNWVLAFTIIWASISVLVSALWWTSSPLCLGVNANNSSPSPSNKWNWLFFFVSLFLTLNL